MLSHLARTLRQGPRGLAVDPPAEDGVAAMVARLDTAARRRLGRSLAIRQVDAGSCNGCELEVHALNGPLYDLERFGLSFVASPRHADILLVTGPVTTNMREALLRTYDATPAPKWVVALGRCAVDGGLFAESYAVVGGVAKVLPVDLVIPGCPPRPLDILAGLLTLVEAEGRAAPPRSAEQPAGEAAADVDQPPAPAAPTAPPRLF